MKRTLAVLLLTIALGVAGLVVFGGPTLRTTTYRPVRLDVLTVAVVVVSLLTQWIVPLFRLRFLAAVHGYRVPRLHAAMAHVAMVFGSAVTPGGSGGAPALAAALAHVGVPLGTSMGVAMQVAVLDLVLFAWLIPVALITRAAVGSLTVPWQVGAAGIAAVAVAVALAMALVRLPRPIVAAVLALTRVRALRRWAPRLRALARSYYRAARTFADLGLGAWSYLQTLTLAAWLASFVMLWGLMRAFGQDAGLLDVVTSMSIVTLVSFFVPTPGAAGFTEAAVSLTAATAPLVWWRLGNFYLAYVLAPLAAWGLWRRPPVAAIRVGVASPRVTAEATAGRPRDGSTRP